MPKFDIGYSLKISPLQLSVLISYMHVTFGYEVKPLWIVRASQWPLANIFILTHECLFEFTWYRCWKIFLDPASSNSDSDWSLDFSKGLIDISEGLITLHQLHRSTCLEPCINMLDTNSWTHTDRTDRKTLYPYAYILSLWEPFLVPFQWTVLKMTIILGVKYILK